MSPSLLPGAMSIAAAVTAALTIAGHYTRPPRRWMIYVFKPVTTLLILALALLRGAPASEAYARPIALGLLLSLAGDILLVLPQDRFVHGLGAFLAGLLCYAYAFRGGASEQGFGWALLLLLAVGAGVMGALWRGLPARLRIPVGTYMLVIVSMAALAAGRALGEPSMRTIPAGAGALLFVASDAMLAIDRFRRPFRLSHAMVLGTYFAAQWLIALSVGGA